jgi:hypothetical protein
MMTEKMWNNADITYFKVLSQYLRKTSLSIADLWAEIWYQDTIIFYGVNRGQETQLSMLMMSSSVQYDHIYSILSYFPFNTEKTKEDLMKINKQLFQNTFCAVIKYNF